MPVAVVVRGGPRHTLALTSVAGVTEVRTLYWSMSLCGSPRYYGPVGLPLASVGLHHGLIPTVFAERLARRASTVPVQPLRTCRPPCPGGTWPGAYPGTS